MQLDGSWFAYSIPEECYGSTAMVPFPSYNPSANPTACVGSTDMGFYITASAWNHPERREAAVSLLRALTAPETIALFGMPMSETLGDSAREMYNSVTLLCPFIGDDMTPEAREQWFAAIPRIADGSADPAQLWNDIVNQGAFAQ